MAPPHRAFVISGLQEASYVERDYRAEVQDVDDTEVIVAPAKTGICGSDIHFFKHGRLGHYQIKQPLVPGHETSGIVVRVGAKVRNLQAGDRVVLELGVACARCVVCIQGKYQLCQALDFGSCPPCDGSLKSIYKLPEHLAYKLPDHVSLEEGALVEPLAVAVHALHNIAALKGNQNVLVMGAGPIGLLTMAAAKAFSARRVIAVDISEERLAFARKYIGAETFLPPARSGSDNNYVYAKECARVLMQQFQLQQAGTEAVDLALDCTGAEVCVQTAIQVVKLGGTVIQVGLGPERIELPFMEMMSKEVLYRGSYRYGPDSFSIALDLVATGRVRVTDLVTHRYAFEDAHKAFETMVRGKCEDGKSPIKIVIDGPSDIVASLSDSV